MPTIIKILATLDRITDATGRLLSWLVLAMAVVTGAVVILRYGFGIGSIALQESITYLHATVFMLGAAYALKHDHHVRVDIFYRNFSPRTKAWINSLGTLLFLLPLCGFILLSSLPFTQQAWQILERSPEPGGIPAVFLLKTLIPLMALNLGLQGISELIRNALLLIEPQPQVEG